MQDWSRRIRTSDARRRALRGSLLQEHRIEVDVTSPSLPRFPIYAAFGVPEVWRYKNGRVSIYRLEQNRYVEAPSSSAFPPLTPEIATRFMEDRKRLDNIAWAHAIQDWARQQRRKPIAAGSSHPPPSAVS